MRRNGDEKMSLETVAVRTVAPTSTDPSLCVRQVGTVTVTGSVTAAPGGGPQNSLVNSTGAGVANQTLIAANANRIAASVFNDSTANLFICLGAVATVNNFSVKLRPGEYYEVLADFRGDVNGVWDVAAGNSRNTELIA